MTNGGGQVWSRSLSKPSLLLRRTQHACAHMCTYSVLWSVTGKAIRRQSHNVFHACMCKVLMKVQHVVLMKEEANCVAKPDLTSMTPCVFCSNSNNFYSGNIRIKVWTVCCDMQSVVLWNLWFLNLLWLAVFWVRAPVRLWLHHVKLSGAAYYFIHWFFWMTPHSPFRADTHTRAPRQGQLPQWFTESKREDKRHRKISVNGCSCLSHPGLFFSSLAQQSISLVLEGLVLDSSWHVPPSLRVRYEGTRCAECSNTDNTHTHTHYHSAEKN